MISAFRRAGSFRGDSAVTTWLHRIVVNAALDRMRRRSARPTVGGGDEDVLDSLASGRAPVSDPSGTTDTQLDVMDALRHLVPDQQAALVLVNPNISKPYHGVDRPSCAPLKAPGVLIVRSLQRHSRCFRITQLSDENDAVLTEDGRDCTGERQTCAHVNLHLADARQSVFDRVFDAHYFNRWPVDVAEALVCCRQPSLPPVGPVQRISPFYRANSASTGRGAIRRGPNPFDQGPGRPVIARVFSLPATHRQLSARC